MSKLGLRIAANLFQRLNFVFPKFILLIRSKFLQAYKEHAKVKRQRVDPRINCTGNKSTVLLGQIQFWVDFCLPLYGFPIMLHLFFSVQLKILVRRGKFRIFAHVLRDLFEFVIFGHEKNLVHVFRIKSAFCSFFCEIWIDKLSFD